MLEVNLRFWISSIFNYTRVWTLESNSLQSSFTKNSCCQQISHSFLHLLRCRICFSVDLHHHSVLKVLWDCNVCIGAFDSSGCKNLLNYWTWASKGLQPQPVKSCWFTLHLILNQICGWFSSIMDDTFIVYTKDWRKFGISILLMEIAPDMSNTDVTQVRHIWLSMPAV